MTTVSALPIIDEATLRSAVGPAAALVSAERAFRALAQGEVVQPPPIGLEIAQVSGEVHVKAAYLAGSPVFAVKIASGFYHPQLGLPSGSGLIVVFDAGNGRPVAVLWDNGYLTDLRTAAAGALAARSLAPPSFPTLGIIGTGAQARYQIRALVQVSQWSVTLVWGRDRERLARYCREMEEETGLPFIAVATAEDVVRAADLLLTLTPSRQPIVQAAWLQRHATVLAIGSDGPEKQELSVEAVMGADKIVVDSLAQCLALGEVHHAARAGVLDPRSIHAELGQIVLGTKPGREADEQIVCDLTGVGAQDAAIAESAWLELNR